MVSTARFLAQTLVRLDRFDVLASATLQQAIVCMTRAERWFGDATGQWMCASAACCTVEVVEWHVKPAVPSGVLESGVLVF